MGRLGGKVVVVSGGARGIGAAIARLFATEGASVLVGDVLDDEGRATAAEIEDAAGRCAFARLDVTVEDDWRRAIATACERYGGLDVLVNNAAIGVPRRADGAGMTIEDLPEADWARVMDVNAKGVFLGTKHAIPALKARGGGAIVNISSITGIVGSLTTVYGASKGAVRVFTKSTALELAAHGIRCNSIHPGAVETAILEKMKADPELYRRNVARHPLGRFGTPEEIAYGALFLACDESSFVTGAELVIDGGLTAQ